MAKGAIGGSSNFSILVDTELDTSNIKKQLKTVEKEVPKIKIGADKSGVKELGLTFQEANLIMSRSIDIISSMVNEVYTLDSALTE